MYTNPYHSEEIRKIFPDIAFHGVDLDNVEVKESESKSGMFSVSNADNRAEYMLFYHRNPHNWFYVVDMKDVPHIKKRRGIRITQVKKLAIFKTKDHKKIKDYVDNLRIEYKKRLEEDVEECQQKQN
jgi:hypothetical protein